MLLRFDAGTIGELRRTPSGGVFVPAAITRTGVFPYRELDGTIRRELRLPEDVFAPESLASLEHAPVTDRHPPELVTPKNHRTYSRGHVASQAARDRKYVAADLAIADAELIEKIERKDAVEVSAGYTCKHEMTAGTYEGETYDCIQRDIRYNHVAIGPPFWNRAGREVALRMDSGAAVLDESRGPVAAPRRGENPVKKIPKVTIDPKKRVMRLDDVSYPIRTQDERDLAKNALESAMRRCTESVRNDAPDAAGMQAMLSDLMATFETLQAQIVAFVDSMAADAAATPASEEKPAPAAVADTGGAPVEEKKEEPKMDAAEIDRRVNERVALISRVQTLAPKIKHDGKTNLELMLETIKTVDATIRLDAGDEKNEALVSGMFRALRPVVAPAGRTHAAIVEAQRSDSSDETPLQKAQRESKEAMANAWKTKTAG